MIPRNPRNPRRGTERQLVVAAMAVVALIAAACNDTTVANVGSGQPSLDDQVRAAISPWGVVPILPITPADPALVDLGRSLFFDKILSGNRDVSCASCHSMDNALGDARSLAVGTDQQLGPRNAPGLFSVGLGEPYLFWDGRVSSLGGGSLTTPVGSALPRTITTVLAAQALLPVLNRLEMRGRVGDHDAFGNANELAAPADTQYQAVWGALMVRLAAVPAYVQKFNAAYPATPMNALGFDAAANAIAAFENATFTKFGSPFDRYLAHDDGALTTDEKQGALLFFGKARCSQCHNGPFLGGQQFTSVAVPQIGPGTGSAAPLDKGAGDPSVRGAFASQPFFFRVAPLRNVELTAPYMHDGAYPTLDAVVRHYNNVDSAVKSYDVTQLDASLRAYYHGDATTINAVRASLDGRLVQPIGLTANEQRLVVAFLKSLTDPAARNLSGIAPGSVPSGLPVQ